MESQIYPAEFQFHKANTTNTEASFFNLQLTQIYDKRDDYDFEIVSFPF